MSIKVRYCKFCGGNLDSDYRCWDISCKFAGVVQVAKHKAKLVAGAAAAASSTASTPAIQSQADKHEPLPEPHKIADEAKAAIAEFMAKLNQQNDSDLAIAKREKERQLRKDESMEQLLPLRFVAYQGFTHSAPDRHDVVIMRFNRRVTQHEHKQLHEIFELMLKGYNDARQR